MAMHDDKEARVDAGPGPEGPSRSTNRQVHPDRRQRGPQGTRRRAGDRAPIAKGKPRKGPGGPEEGAR